MMQLVDYYAFRKKHISIRDAYNNGKNSKYYFWGWLQLGCNWRFRSFGGAVSCNFRSLPVHSS